MTIYKIVQLARLGLGRRKGLTDAIIDAGQGRVDEAMNQVGTASGVVPRVLTATLAALRHRPGDTDYAEELGRQAAIGELSAMSRNMRILEQVVQAAPMLGLLGTVIGMIDAFARLSEATGAVDPALLAGGIYTALTTTAAGLSIAIVFYFVTGWLESRIERERQDMELAISSALYGLAPSSV
ncbi:MAG: MotA/TolQ/ExbB proton channel family protein [Pseudomonadota bacterium]